MIIRAAYHYDALDRLAVRSDPVRGAGRYFYCDEQRSTETRNGQHRRFLRSDRHLLAQQEGLADSLRTLLLLTDRADSVLGVADAPLDLMRYTPYGHHVSADILAGVPGFNGEHPDPLTGHYPLGNGYRSYNPVLMRFNSPDSLSPFGEGGVNAYAYCKGDPVNRRDPTGQASWQFVVGLTLSAISLGIALVTLFPSLPFIVSAEAALAGFVNAGSLSTLATGVAGVTGGVVSITRQIVQEVAPDSSLLEPLGWTALALGVTAISTRLGSVIAARNPKNLADLKAAIENRGRPVFIQMKELGASLPTPPTTANAGQIRGFP